ncbi:MAG: hypothetical protein LUI87_03435 [Lachnospiraceae bacterium]|nr:hypothetical protein [Lachnospiraceae bacterium]
MRGLREACVVCASKDYAEAVYFKEFLKWTGFSFFIFIFNEHDDKLNEVIAKDTGTFDFVIYIGDQDGTWERRFSQQSDVHVHVPVEELWVPQNGKKKPVLRDDLLVNAWKEIFQEFSPRLSSDSRKVFNKLIQIYCKYNVLHRLASGIYSMRMLVDKEAEKIKKAEGSLEKTDRYGGWKSIIKCLEDFREGLIEKQKYDGMEYLAYALCFCKRKVNEYCNLLKIERTYGTGKVLEQLESVYDYVDDFYMVENLKAKISSLDRSYKSFSISYLLNCTKTCDVNLCNSFHYYRIGKQMEIIQREEEAAKAYRISYMMNPLNFRALFKLAADQFRRKEWSKSAEYLKGILNILQLNTDDDSRFEKQVLFLPPLELEYVSKCYALLGRIDEYLGNREEDMVFCYRRVEQVKQCVRKNKYLSAMYSEVPDWNAFCECVEERLTKNAIKNKLEKLNVTCS